MRGQSDHHKASTIIAQSRKTRQTFMHEQNSNRDPPQISHYTNNVNGVVHNHKNKNPYRTLLLS